MNGQPRWVGHGLTDRGRVRASNQDALHLADGHGLWVVADGMGGHAGGDVASQIAVERLASRIQQPEAAAADPAAWLTEAIREANRAVYEEAQRRELAGMGTTIVAVRIVRGPPSDLIVAHVGDSRAYSYRDGLLRGLTRDHTLPEEAVRAGLLSADDARRHPHRHVLSRAVGPDVDVQPDVQRHPLASDAMLLLCTDGLTKMLDDDHIATILRSFPHRPQDACRALIEEANRLGGDDNITVVLLAAD